MKPMRLFLILTFALFIVGFAITGLLFALDSPNYFVVIAQIAMAWTPTMAFAIIHRRLNTDRSFWSYVADQFATRIKTLPLLASLLIPVVATTIVWIGYSVASGKALQGLLADLSVGSLLVVFFDGLVRGPLGEELGWRGYLQTELSKRFTLLKSSLIVGVIWGLWHLPLWFISGFQGTDLLLYIAFFMAGLVSFAVIIGYVYGRGGNLLYAILLHQMLNFAGRLLQVDDLIVLGGSSAVYVLIALALGLMSLRPKAQAALTA